MLSQEHITANTRFSFGSNWTNFLLVLNEQRISEAEESLKSMLKLNSLANMRFLDVGSGSGLFSLAARRLGAEVVSFDYDLESVACTESLKQRFFSGDKNWQVMQGDILDKLYVERLGKFDVVYSWGVLHHTGKMWQALENVHPLVKDQGQLFIAIYDDRGWKSRVWKSCKFVYNKMPRLLKPPFALLVMIPSELRYFAFGLKFNIPAYIRTWTKYHLGGRGMNRWHDIIDWVGGYPFDVATPKEITEFYQHRKFTLVNIKTSIAGCNEFVFTKE